MMVNSQIAERIECELLTIDSGVRRIRLTRGLGLAYGGNVETGLLTLSRMLPEQPPSDDEVRIVQHDFVAAAERIGRPVYRFRELSREVVGNGRSRHHVIRFRVYFGEQGRLF